MRARRLGTHSQLINTLLAEEEERLSSHAVLRRASRGLSPREIKSLFDALTAGGRRGAVADLLAGRR